MVVGSICCSKKYIVRYDMGIRIYGIAESNQLPTRANSIARIDRQSRMHNSLGNGVNHHVRVKSIPMSVTADQRNTIRQCS